MATAPKQQRAKRPPPTTPSTSIIGAQAGGAAVGSAISALAGTGAMAVGAQGPQAIIDATTTAMLGVLAGLALGRGKLISETLRARHLPEGDIADALAEEERREVIYRKLAEQRIRAGLKLAMASEDPSVRAAAIQAVLNREQNIAYARAAAASERVLAAAERQDMRQRSPQGALWVLGAREKHCPLCVALNGKFWPWVVLDKLPIPLHVLCGCHLKSFGDALHDGDILPGDIPTDAAALKLAGPIIAEYQSQQATAEAKYAHLAEAATNELLLRVQLLEAGEADVDFLAAVPLAVDAQLAEDFNPAERRDRAGKWTKGINVVPGADFHAAFTTAFKGNPRAGFVTPYSAKDFAGMKTFLSRDGKTGGALKNGDEIVSLFSSGETKGAGGKMLDHLTSNGGKRLDCLGDGLRGYYEKHGFQVTKTLPWDDTYAPSNWDYKAHGRPNVYVMEHGHTPATAFAKASEGIPDEKPSQPSDKIDEVFKAAQSNRSPFEELLDKGDGLSKQIGASELVEEKPHEFGAKAAALDAAPGKPIVVIPPMKTQDSAAEKLQRKSYGAEGLGDINRASVLVNNLSELPKVFATTRGWAESKGWTLHETDDNLFKGKGVGGYRDIAVVLKSPDGHITELQFHVNSMWSAKFSGGHALYEQTRALDAKAMSGKLTAEQVIERANLERKMATLYEKAYKAASVVT